MKTFMIFTLIHPLITAPQYGQSSGSLPSLQPPAASASQSVSCRTENQVVWDTKYVETETQECSTISVPKCSTKYKKDCEYQWEGTGNNKVWAPIPGTCNNNAYDSCGDVQKQKLKQVPYQDCKNVPRQVCRNVPKQECRTVNDQECQQVPYKDCQNVPQQQCIPVHKKVPQRISRNVPKKVCDGGSGYGGGSGFNSGSGFNGNNGSQGGFNGGNGVFRNTDPDAEFLSEKQQIKPKSGDAVNFGK